MNLPSGIVTFLFTDIEGSTWLWEEYPLLDWEQSIEYALDGSVDLP